MGGAISAVGKGIGAIGTGGLSIVAPNSIFGKAGNTVGNALTLGGANLGGSNPSAPTVGGTQSPLDTLNSSGGAPLLMDISLGADVGTSIMSYFGASGNYNTWLSNLDPASQQAISGLNSQLSQIQTNTNQKNSAITQLTNDFPNMMAQKIPQYTAIMDAQTANVAKLALQNTAAQYAAGGTLSSGAMAQAMSNTAAGLEQQNTVMGTNLALQDYQQQLNGASALQSFQMKMLGQGAQQGFNAVQNALAGNRQIQGQQAGLNQQQNMFNQQSQNASLGAIGQLGGTIIGSALGGPAGGAAGGAIGSTLTGNSGVMSNPNLNLPGQNFGANSGPSYGLPKGF